MLQGGAGYWPDEGRYLRSLALLGALLEGRPGAALDGLLRGADHVGFTLLALPAALLHAVALAGGPATPERLEATLWVPALPLSLASVVCIAALHALARRLGAGPGEALLAAFLLATSTSGFYFARHLQPYDASLALALFALWLGLPAVGRGRGGVVPDAAPGTGRSFAVGLAAGAAFLVYYGYWPTAGVAAAAHLAFLPEARRLRAGLACAAGLAVGPLLLSAASALRGLPLFAREMARFSEQAATQTEFAEGGTLPFAYLGHAEGPLLAVWLLGAAGAAWLALREPGPRRRRAALWLAWAVGTYALLGLFSVGLERIGGFGRLARQLVPPLCLAAALAGAAALRGRPRLAALGVVALAALAGRNFAGPLAQRFPAELLREVEARHGPVARVSSVVGSRSFGVPGLRGAQPAPPPPEPGRHRLLDAAHFFPVQGRRAAPAGRVLLRAPHPLAYRPYQYEGYTPRERALLRRPPLEMQLLEPEAPADSGPPGPAGALPPKARPSR